MPRGSELAEGPRDNKDSNTFKYIYLPCSGPISEEGGLCSAETCNSCGRAGLCFLLELLKSLALSGSGEPCLHLRKILAKKKSAIGKGGLSVNFFFMEHRSSFELSSSKNQ